MPDLTLTMQYLDEKVQFIYRELLEMTAAAENTSMQAEDVGQEQLRDALLSLGERLEHQATELRDVAQQTGWWREEPSESDLPDAQRVTFPKHPES